MESKNAAQVATDLEYNDGLGDLLREKEKLEFSWIKTSTVLVFVLAIIIATTSFILNLVKPFYKSNQVWLFLIMQLKKPIKLHR